MRGNDDRRLMAITAAAIYGGAAGIGVVEGLIPGGAQADNAPGFVALFVALVAPFAGPRLPRNVLALLGPAGACLIGWSIVGTDGSGNGAMLYAWVALWLGYFCERTGVVMAVVSTGVVELLVLNSLGERSGNADRWVDIVAAVAVVAAVTAFLSRRNQDLVGKLRDEARIDPLTGLLNRRGLRERLAIEAPRSLRSESPMVVVMFDIDYFKRINDEYGHEVGDRVLTWVGDLLTRAARATDAPARTGGEEFVVLMPDTGEQAAVRMAERARSALAAGNGRRDHGVPDSIQLTMSAGVAVTATADGDAALALADKALYAAKREGRNRTVAAGAGPRALPASDGQAPAVGAGGFEGPTRTT